MAGLTPSALHNNSQIMSSLNKGHDSASPKNGNRTQTMLMNMTMINDSSAHLAPTLKAAAGHFHHNYHFNHQQLIATLATNNGSSLKKGIAGNPFGTAAVKTLGNKKEEAIESGGTIIKEEGLATSGIKEEI
jgi:hypothetical protein